MERTLTKIKWVRTLLALFFAIILTSFGVVFFIHANLGSDTITVFFNGIQRTFSLSLGISSLIYNVLALSLACILSFKDIGWTSIIYALSTGFFMDLFDPFIAPLHLEDGSLVIRLLMVCLGQLCIIVSFSLLIRYGSGMDQLDAIAYGLNRRLHIAYPIIRTLIDIILLVCGFLMGGVVGVGSIIAMSTTGIGINTCLKFMDYLKKKKMHHSNMRVTIGI